MAGLRTLLLIVGAVMFISGVFFALQGAGFIMWPADSFMLADHHWVTNGLIIALAGAAVYLFARRVGTSA
ncbi:MAG: hypothetical protein ABIW31_01245 [Novosphingobium sp.]